MSQSSTSRLKLIASLCAMLALFAIPAFLIRSPTPDWPSFYAGAKLAREGSVHLYSFAASQAITGRFMDPTWVWAFLRPPVYATAFYPLGLLKPHAAFLVWQTLNLAAIVCVVMLLWRSPAAVGATLACAPLWTSLKQGQDIPFLILAAALSIALAEVRRPYLAGIVLALCGMKFHLLLLIPIFLCARKAWSMAAGLLSGAGVLIGACFLLYGRSWVADYLRCAVENEKHLKTTSLLWLVPSVWWPIGVCLAAGILTFALCRYAKTDGTALAISFAMGLMVAPRFYFYDLAIGLPALLLIMRRLAEPSAAVNLPREMPLSSSLMLQNSHSVARQTTIESYI